jgi:hypothetical protein
VHPAPVEIHANTCNVRKTTTSRRLFIILWKRAVPTMTASSPSATLVKCKSSPSVTLSPSATSSPNETLSPSTRPSPKRCHHAHNTSTRTTPSRPQRRRLKTRLRPNGWPWRNCHRQNGTNVDPGEACGAYL